MNIPFEHTFRVEAEDYRLLVDSVSDYAILMLDPQGHVVSWNTGAQRIKGYAPQEIIGKHFSIFYPEADIKAGKPEIELKCAARDGRFEDEGWRVRKDGTMFWANVVVTPLFSEDGSLRGFGKVTRDLTERKQAEETARELLRAQTARAAAEESRARIRESEERYRALSQRLEVILQGVSDGITVQDPTGRIVFANDAAAAIAGFTTGTELVAASVSELRRHVEVLDEAGKPVASESLPGPRAIRGEKMDPLTVRIRHRKTGHEWWASIQAGVVRDAKGAPELVVNIWHDVTARHRKQEQARYLAESTAAMAMSLDLDSTLSALAHVLVPDLADWCTIDMLEDDRLRNATVAHRDPAKVALAHELQQRFPQPDMNAPQGAPNVIRTGKPELFPEITEEMLAQSSSNPEQVKITRELGLRSAMVVPLGAHGRVFGAMTLITAESQRRYDEEDLAIAEEIGRRAGIAIDNARLYREAKDAVRRRDDFLSVASHELKTPLTSLELHLGSLVHAVKRGRISELAPEKLADRVGKAYDQIQRLTVLSNDLLDVSRIAGGRLALRIESFDLRQLAHEVCERFDDDAKRIGSPLQLIADEPIRGDWDRSRVDQIITNLVSNALKYGRGEPVELEVRRVDDRACITVHDHGIGIKTEDQKRIFDRFERTDDARNFGGLGLGLWIVRQICEAHGGRVSVSSKPGQGAKFVVELPLAGGVNAEGRVGGG